MRSSFSHASQMTVLLLACAFAGAQTVAKPLQVGGSVQPPVVIHAQDPKYPHHSFFHKAKASDVTVHAIIDENGSPQDVSISKSGGREFDDSALAAVRQYTFKPATQNGKPVAVEINIQVMFRIY